MSSNTDPPIQIFEPPRPVADGPYVGPSSDTNPPESEDRCGSGQEPRGAVQPRHSSASTSMLAVVFTVIVTVALVLYLVHQTIATYGRMTQDLGPIFAGEFLALVVAASILLGWGALRALLAYRRLTNVVQFRSQAQRRLLGGERLWSDNELFRWIERYATPATGDDDELRSWRAALTKQLGTHRDAKLAFEQLDQGLLRRLDERADGLIQSNAAAVAFGTAVAGSMFDALIVLWRVFAVINGVASTYGGRPGVLGSLRLLRRGMYLTVAAGIADQIADAVTGILSNRAMAALSGRATQGLGNGILLLRLGHAIKCECRPLPFDDRASLLAQLGALGGAIWRKGGRAVLDIGAVDSV